MKITTQGNFKVDLSDFPLFYLVVESDKYTLHNQTGYDIDKDCMNRDKQLEHFKEYSALNVKRGGKAVKRVTIVVNSNKHPIGNDVFKKGWKPIQDKKASKNVVRSYIVEFVNDPDAIWLSWSVSYDAPFAVFSAGRVLRGLADISNYPSDVQKQYVAARQRNG